MVWFDGLEWSVNATICTAHRLRQRRCSSGPHAGCQALPRGARLGTAAQVHAYGHAPDSPQWSKRKPGHRIPAIREDNRRSPYAVCPQRLQRPVNQWGGAAGLRPRLERALTKPCRLDPAPPSTTSSFMIRASTVIPYNHDLGPLSKHAPAVVPQYSTVAMSQQRRADSEPSVRHRPERGLSK